jgi:hypothetical protein
MGSSLTEEEIDDIGRSIAKNPREVFIACVVIAGIVYALT